MCLSCTTGIGLTLNNVQYTNNSVVNITDIGTGSAALICTTTNQACCLSTDGSHWYFHDGSAVQRTSTTYYRTRTVYNGIVGTVRLNRNPGATTTGVFRCDIRDASGGLQSIYVGIYTYCHHRWVLYTEEQHVFLQEPTTINTLGLKVFLAN